MCTGDIVTTIGLIFDICGAILITFFGIPTLLSRDGGEIPTFGYSEREEKKAKHYDNLALLGMVLLILGFSGQIIGIWID